MNAEQKQRAKDALTNCQASDMAALLQEMIDAPETEPVATVTGYYGGHLTISTVDGRVLPAGTALYLAPPAPSVHVSPMENIALDEWMDKTEWVQKEINTFPVSSLGMHRADVMRIEIERLREMLAAPPAPSVPDWQGWAMRLIDFIEGAEVSSGMCCCGDDMARHASPINCGHSPVDMWDNCVKNLRAEFDKFVAAAPPAPSVPDGWRSAIAKEFPLYDEDGLDEDKHCCEWVMLQERKRLHKMLAAAPTPAEAPAEVVRGAERYRACNGSNCGCTDGISHSDDCISEHDAIVAEAARVDHVEHGGWKCYFCGYDGQDNQRYNQFCARCKRHR